MLFTKPFKEAIANGEITTSFRLWKRPMVKVGGQYNIPPFGAIEVTKVAATTLDKTSQKSVRAAGFTDKAALADYLKSADAVPLYRVEFRYLGAATVKVPDRDHLDQQELDKLVKRLRKIAWAEQALQLIANNVKTRAGDLAPQCNMELQAFKRNVRRLKGMGLTISHDVGYELSERGKQVLPLLRASQ